MPKLTVSCLVVGARGNAQSCRRRDGVSGAGCWGRRGARAELLVYGFRRAQEGVIVSSGALEICIQCGGMQE